MNVLQDAYRRYKSRAQATAPDEAVRKALAYLPARKAKPSLSLLAKPRAMSAVRLTRSTIELPKDLCNQVRTFARTYRRP